MKNIAVIGLGFGDEGKGSIVDYLCSKEKNPIVIRYSGGQQAGHTVFNKTSHVFANFGSGTLQGVPTYWSKFCTIDPIGILNEYNLLKQKGINPILYIDRECPITTPCDIQHNLWVEEQNKHGTCGVGVGATIQREENHYHLKFRDIFYPQIFKIKFELVKQYYGYDYQKTIIKNDLDVFFNAVNFLRKNENIKGWSFVNLRDIKSTYIFEGSQGLILDQTIGFFPHVTRANTGTKNILELVNNISDIYLVTRAYQTRHGNGAMTNDDIPHNIKDNPYETNISFNKQGEFRKSLLDLNLILYAINSDMGLKKCENKILVITCLDQMVDDYRFTFNEKIFYCNDKNDFIKKITKILQIKNILINESPYSKTITKFN